MVGKRGFEPRTPASRTLCSTRLSHFPRPESIYRKETSAKSRTFDSFWLVFIRDEIFSYNPMIHLILYIQGIFPHVELKEIFAKTS
jgi:hypothetical protein